MPFGLMYTTHMQNKNKTRHFICITFVRINVRKVNILEPRLPVLH